MVGGVGVCVEGAHGEPCDLLGMALCAERAQVVTLVTDVAGL